MCGGDDHLAWKHLLSLEVCERLCILRRLIQCFCVHRSIFVPNLDSPSWTRVRGRLTRASDQPNQRLDQRDMDSQVVTIAQFAATMALIQEVIAGLSQRIDRREAPPRDSARTI
ncbi:hypothetical protein AAG906_020492 [Vitis piasezkii]